MRTAGHTGIVVAACLVLSLLLAAGCTPGQVELAQDKGSDATPEQEVALEKYLTLDLGQGVTMKLVLVSAGTFAMGSPETEPGRGEDEVQHPVTISKPFYMGVTEVTQAHWRAVMGTEPWKGDKHAAAGDDYPAGYISWDDATSFCKALSKKMGIPLRLPTEAEWEHACRARTTTRFHCGDEPNYRKLRHYAWYEGNAHDTAEKCARPVGRKKPNAWGLYDMHGNVREWCSDWYAGPYLPADGASAAADLRDPKGPDSGKYRVLRGGSWNSGPLFCRTAARSKLAPGYRFSILGFRAAVASGPAVTSLVHARSKATSRPTTRPGSDKHLSLTLANGVTMKLVRIEAGKFTSGSPATEKDRDRDEGPQRKLTISRPFYLGVTEVTQAQWRAVMNTEPWKSEVAAKTVDDHAASCITWDDAVLFCKALSKTTGRTVRLPTEAEWEYACRAGTATRFHYGDDRGYKELGDYAWYGDNAHKKNEKYAHPVGRKKPNAWGLYDMHGNVCEWCSDWYADLHVPVDGAGADPDTRDPKGPGSGSARVLRGGSWISHPQNCRTANRERCAPDVWGMNYYGFRVVVASGSDVK